MDFRSRIWFDLKSCPKDYRITASSASTYFDSDTYETLMSYIYPDIEGSLRNVIIPTRVSSYRYDSRGSSILDSESRDVDIFLLSVSEIQSNRHLGNYTFPSEGSQFALFTNTQRLDKGEIWLLRSIANGTDYLNARANADGAYFNNSGNSCGINFGFRV